MVVFHKIEACGRCRGATMWRLTNGKLQCGRCHRRKRVSRRRPSSVWSAHAFLRAVISSCAAQAISRFVPGSPGRCTKA